MLTDAYKRIDEFIAANPDVKEFKVEDDNHGMGMISTIHPELPKKAVNVHLPKESIQKFLVDNSGFKQTVNGDVLSREKQHQ